MAFFQFVVILVSPLIGAVADETAREKTFLMVTAVVCSVGTAGLDFVGAGEIWLALALVCVANIAFSLSENLCPAFLPEISTPANAGRISGYGWSFGYWGFFGKLAGVIGPFVFGWLATWLGFRVANMANAGFFIAGLLVLLGLRFGPRTDGT